MMKLQRQRPTLFVSYRRSTDEHFAVRLAQDLKQRFGTAIFIDQDLPPGVALDEFLRQRGMSSALMLVVIGSQWLARDADGKRRIDDPNDWIHKEIAVALKSKLDIIPILNNCSMPKAEELPEDIREFADRLGVEFPTGQLYQSAFDRLSAALEARGFRRLDRPLPYECVFVVLGIILLLMGGGFLGQLVSFPMNELFESASDVAGAIATTFLGLAVGMGIGPLCVVGGVWLCCGRKWELSRGDPIFSAKTGVAPHQKSKKSVAALALGLSSFGLGPITGIAAIVMGAWALVDIWSRGTWLRGRSLAIQGICYAVIGMLAFWVFVSHATELHALYADIDKARSASEQGDNRSADALLQPAMDAGLADAFIELGVVKYQTGDMETALQLLTEAIVSLPDKPKLLSASTRRRVARAYYFRSLAHEKVNEHESAREDLTKARTFDAEIVAPNAGGDHPAPPAPPLPMADPIPPQADPSDSPGKK